MPMWSISV